MKVCIHLSVKLTHGAQLNIGQEEERTKGILRSSQHYILDRTAIKWVMR